MSAMTTVTPEAFEREVLKSRIPVALFFKMVGCPHCARMMPVMEEIAEEFAGKLKVVPLEVKEWKRKAGDYRVFSVPQIIFLKGGEKVDVIKGQVPKEKVVEKIKAILG